MKKKLTITGVFNDELTGYKDKVSNVSFTVDDEKDCTCDKKFNCIIHNPPPNYTISDYD